MRACRNGFVPDRGRQRRIVCYKRFWKGCERTLRGGNFEKIRKFVHAELVGENPETLIVLLELCDILLSISIGKGLSSCSTGPRRPDVSNKYNGRRGWFECQIGLVMSLTNERANS